MDVGYQNVFPENLPLALGNNEVTGRASEFWQNDYKISTVAKILTMFVIVTDQLTDGTHENTRVIKSLKHRLKSFFDTTTTFI